MVLFKKNCVLKNHTPTKDLLRDCSEFLVRGGVVLFFTHIKKETEQSKISLSCNSPATLDAPFTRFAPAARISFRRQGGGVPIFDNDFEGGVPKLYGDSERGYAFWP